MITIVLVKNPFSPAEGREMHTTEYVPGKTVADYVKEYVAIYGDKDGYTISVNSFTCDADRHVIDFDFIVLAPVVGKGGGKNPLILVAAIALSVYSMGFGAHVASMITGSHMATLAAASGWAAIGGYLAAAAVMFVGSSLINRAFGTASVDNGSAAEANPTYTWSGIQTLTGQNNAIAVTYGTVKSGGQTIGKYLSSADDKQYLNWLIAAGEGPLEFSDIRLNDNPIGNFQGVVCEKRSGTNNQSIISNFGDTISSKGLGYEITENEYRTDTVTGTATQGIIVSVECSNGLYYTKDNGSLTDAWVELVVQYSKKDAGDWKDMSTATVRITGAKASAIRKDIRVDNLAAGEYDVRVKVSARSHAVTVTRASTRIWWSAVSSIVYDDFCYPGIALLGIKALATDQISGSPSLTFIKNRATVWIYNTDTAAYEAKDARNPAWAAYDYIHQAYQTINMATGGAVIDVRGTAADLLMYDRFAEWASFCDEKNLKIDIEINTTGEMLASVNKYIAPIGRGMVLLFGTKYGCVWDCVKQATQMFGMGNIRSGTFNESFLPTADRANAIEITFTNKEKDYQRDTMTVYSSDYDNADSYSRTAQVSYDGITDYKQAYREGVFQLRCNERQIRTVSFDADVDAIACTVGDVIYVSHDIPKWATSGRIASVNGTTVVINAHMADYDAATTYQLTYRAGETDTLYTVPCTAVTAGDDATTVVLKSIPDVMPSAGDVCDVSSIATGSKPFVVKSIGRTTDFVRKIEALEYDESVFDEDYDIPAIDYTTAGKTTAVNVTNLTGNQQLWMAADGSKKSRMYLSWSMPAGYGYSRFSVFLSTDDGITWIPAGTTGNMAIELDTVYGQDYKVKVITIYGVSTTTGTVTTVAAGIDELPPDVTALNCELMASGLRRYWWDFVYPNINDIAGFRMKYTQGTSLNWDAGIPVQDGLITTQPYETQTVRQGTHAVMIKAVDNAGNESDNFAYCILDMGDLLEQNVLYTIDYAADSWSGVTHTGYVNADTGYIEPRNDTYMWLTPSEYMWKNTDDYEWASNWQSYTVDAEFTAPTSGQFWLLYDISGPAIVYYRKNGTSSYWGMDKDAAAWPSETDTVWKNSGDLWKQYSDRVMVRAGERIQIRIQALNNINEMTVVKALKAVIDVPDRTEHFEDILVPTTGLALPISTPHYYTTAVRIDAVQGDDSGIVLLPRIVSRNPCVIKLVDSTGNPASATIDATWQGYQREVL